MFIPITLVGQYEYPVILCKQNEKRNKRSFSGEIHACFVEVCENVDTWPKPVNEVRRTTP